MSKKRKGVIGEAVEKLETLSSQLEEVNTGLWLIGTELARLNDLEEAFMKYMTEKGLITKAR